MSSIDGIRKAKVFPLPVLAAARMSLQIPEQRTTASVSTESLSGCRPATIPVTSDNAIFLMVSKHFAPQWSTNFYVFIFYSRPDDLPSFQQGANAFLLDLRHVFEAHLLHRLQRALTHQPGESGERRVLERT